MKVLLTEGKKIEEVINEKEISVVYIKSEEDIKGISFEDFYVVDSKNFESNSMIIMILLKAKRVIVIDSEDLRIDLKYFTEII